METSASEIELTMTQPSIILNTKGTYCDKDIKLTAALQNKTVTENGQVTADDGYAGLRSVTVNFNSEDFVLKSELTDDSAIEVLYESGVIEPVTDTDGYLLTDDVGSVFTI